MSPTGMSMISTGTKISDTFSSSGKLAGSEIGAGVDSRPHSAQPQTTRSTLVMISPDLDGSTTSGRYSLGAVEAQNWVGSFSEVEGYLGTLKNQADSIGAVVVSAGFGSDVSRLVSALRQACPQAPLVACGRNLFGHILPLTPRDVPLTHSFDFAVRNTTEIPVIRWLTIAGSSLQIFQTGRVVGTCRPISLEDPETPLPELQHVPWTVREAAAQVQLNRRINQRIRDRYYADRFVVVAALPKSASSVIGSSVSVIQTGSKNNRKYGSYMLQNQDSDLRPEILRDFPDGGVVKYHPSASGKNLKVLDLLGCRYLIILRDPADQVAALYAHVLNSCSEKSVISTTAYEHIFPLHKAMFNSSVPIETTIDYLIRGGYLLHSLAWITDWLVLRDPQRSAVVRYEDFVLDRMGVLNGISRWLTARDFDVRLSDQCGQIAESYKTKQTGAIQDGSKKYPRGWTGKIGTWRDYFSAENRKHYCATVADFIRCYPSASVLLQVYPDLLTTGN